jgi:ribosomal protein S18 acetylase RimI-like enzyme
MNYKVRKARLSDAEGLGRLYLEFWGPHRKVDPLIEMRRKITVKKEIESAKKEIKSKKSFTFVADKDGEIIGFIELLIKKNDRCFKVKKYGYLNAAATLKKYRGKGVAKALAKAGFKSLKDKGIEYVQGRVYNTNKTALEAWEKIGLKPQSTMLFKKL